MEFSAFFLTSMKSISVQQKPSLPEVLQFPPCLTQGFKESAGVGVALTSWGADSLVGSELVHSEGAGLQC